MTFLYPSFLWAFFAIAVPIIIHIFNFRTHKTVYFSNVDFLENIDQEAKSKNKIKNLLILLFRILTISSLVIAFANPVKYQTSHSRSDCSNKSIIYIDNSFSMDLLNGKTSSIDRAKSKAVQIINSLPDDTKFFILSNDFTTKQQHSTIKTLAQKYASQIFTDAKQKKSSFILNKISQIVKNEKLKCFPHIFFISDFQKNTFDAKNFSIDTNYKITLLPTEPEETDNLYIDSLWFASPYRVANTTDSLFVKIKNTSQKNYTNKSIRLYINDSLRTISSFNIKTNSQTTIKLFFSNNTTGFIAGKVEIQDFPVSYDNTMFFSYYIAPKIKILLINDNKQQYLQNFYTSKDFELTKINSNNIPYGTLKKFQTIILNQTNNFSSGLVEELQNYIQNGGIVIFIPSMQTDINTLNKFFQNFNLPKITKLNNQKLLISKINLNDKIYKNAFESIKHNSIFPSSNKHFSISSNNLNINKILQFENNETFLYYKKIGKGNFYVFTSALDDKTSDFILSPLMVPTFFNIPVFRANNNSIYYNLGNEKLIKINNTEAENLQLKAYHSDFSFFPQIVLRSDNSIKINIEQISPPADNYKILDKQKQIGILSLNYSRQESVLNFYTKKELKKLLMKYNLKNFNINTDNNLKLQNDIKTKITGKKYWKLFVIFALVFLLAEIITIRLTDK
jgi:hypothetical protein